MNTSLRAWIPAMAAATICVGAVSWRAGADAAAQSAPQTSVAVINLQRLYDGLNGFTEMKAAVVALRDQLQDQVNKLEEQINLLTEERNELPDGKLRREKSIELRQLQAQYTSITRDSMSWLQLEQGKALRTIYGEIAGAVAVVAQRDGWDVVLWDHEGNIELQFPPGNQDGVAFTEINTRILFRNVAYTSPRADITQLVIDTMNNAHAVGR
ncbi:MAG: OmpH family outer membrane protein [Phycisphaerales bacterium JB039]